MTTLQQKIVIGLVGLSALVGAYELGKYNGERNRAYSTKQELRNRNYQSVIPDSIDEFYQGVRVKIERVRQPSDKDYNVKVKITGVVPLGLL